ncbi:transcriptional regulator with XRE-family HTH domain [Oxalobacteraceae bacterium GrIS 2.11]
MAKNFGTLRNKMSSDSQARAAAKTEAMMTEMRLQELRLLRNVTQVEMAEFLALQQSAISKLEHRDDMYVSTLRQYIRALGGELKLIASFPDIEIPLHNFEI